MISGSDVFKCQQPTYRYDYRALLVPSQLTVGGWTAQCVRPLVAIGLSRPQLQREHVVCSSRISVFRPFEHVALPEVGGSGLRKQDVSEELVPSVRSFIPDHRR
jgi:hypothetical protein